ncbi:fungal-specific transcription factor domain-containing protein [Phaeosphaeria sp. MPI-PUGE-AT-0046c]|nr:fungal-specific transcription factor domain-containing protein [Phaeosphaeria sp. MPI-PUGE-AT-0046c]
MSSTTKRSNVRRSNVTACARCKSRKQRCDQNIPACSNCERAGVECVGNDADGSVLPRSYIKSLEDHVARLEQELASLRATDHGVPPVVTSVPRDYIESALSQASLVSLHPSTFPSPRYMGTASGLPLLHLLLVGLGIPRLKESLHPNDVSTSTIAALLQQESAMPLPGRDVCYRLFDAYLEHCNFFSPMFYRTDILRMRDNAEDPSALEDRVKTFLILAIAVQLLNRTDSSIPASRASAFFSAATDILSTHAVELLTGDVSHLEVLLLMIQYSSFSANPAGTWHMVGLATRLVIDLGLHDEPSPHSFDAFALDRRRRLFWATYTFERNLCSVLGRPVSIPDQAITTSLPASVDEEYITAAGILAQAEPSRTGLGVHMIKYRRIESEIMQVLHQAPPLATNEFDYHMWRKVMRDNLYNWRNTLPFHQNPTQLAPIEMFDGCLYNSLIQIYSPSRHLPQMTGEHTVFLAGCAQKSIEAYRTCFRDGKLRFYWRTIHNLFRAGISLIYCVRNWPLEEIMDLDSIHVSLNSCSSILWGMVERYPAGRACRDMFETLYDSYRKSKAEQSTPIEPHLDAINALPRFPSAFPGDMGPHLGHAPFDLPLQDINMQDFITWDL